MALEKAAQPAPATSDAMLRSAIVNVTSYFLRMAAGTTPAEMEAIIWQHDSIDGVDHGQSCAAFASLTLELASQLAGQQSWVTGGTSYPWPLHKWADVRVDPNAASPGVVSVVQDAEAHHRWHALGDGYQPQPGDWVLFPGHIEVVTKYADAVLHTIGGDSLPDFSVNAHEYRGPLAAQGVTGFVNNGELPGPAGTRAGRGHTAGTHQTQSPQAQSPQAQSPQAQSPQAQRHPQRAEAAPPAAPSGASPAAPSASGPAPGPTAAAAPAAPTPPGGPATTPGSPAAHPSSPTAAPGAPREAAPAPGAGSDGPAPAGNPGDAAIPGLPLTAAGPGQGGQPVQHQPRQQDRSQPQDQVPPPAITPPASGHTGSSQPPSSPPASNPPAGSPPASTSPAGGSASGSPPSGPARSGQADHAGAPAEHRAPPAGHGATAPGEASPGAAAIPGVSSSAHQPGAGSAAPHTRHNPPPTAIPAHNTSAQQAFINEVAPGAVAAQHTYGVPASVTIAQAIDESGWGQSTLAAKDHNLFGIKGSGPAGSDPLPTQEYENGQWTTRITLFRVYHNAAESIDDHGRLIATSGYYRQAMADRQDPNAFAHALTGVYATDPDYGAKLIRLMRRYNLYRYDVVAPNATPPSPASAPAAAPGAATIPGLPHNAAAPPAGTQAPIPGTAAPGTTRQAGGQQSAANAAPSAQTVSATRIPAQPAQVPAQPAQVPAQPTRAGRQPTGVSTQAGRVGQASRALTPAVRFTPRASRPVRRVPARGTRGGAARYKPHLPPSVSTAFITTTKERLLREEPLYRDIASHTGIPWELLAACDWMQCKARARYSPVHGEKLGSLNADGTVYRTRSEALAQCADDLAELAWAVYGIDLTARGQLSVRDLASTFAAFRWGGLLRAHHTSAMEFPYSVAGLTPQHLHMRWPNIDEPNTPDRPGARFRMPFGAVPIVLGLHYPATV